MQKKMIQLILILFFNIIVALIFIGSNVNFWDSLNNYGTGYYSQQKWGPISIDISGFAFLQSGPKLALYSSYLNSPFILFWVSTLGNLFFVLWILFKKETKQVPS